MKKILVVDNHPVIVKFLTDLFEGKGYEVQSAVDGLSALEVLRTFRPDVAFIDLVMPNISGDKFCRIVRSMPRFGNLHLVILSGIAAEEKVDFREFGASACIAKGPFPKMAENVLGLLDQLDSVAASELPTGTIGLEDIYAREISRELLSLKRHSEAVLRNLSEGILELTLEGFVILANEAAVSSTGLPEERLLAAKFTELFDETHRGRIASALDKIGEGPQKIDEEAPVVLNGRYLSLTLLEVKDEDNTSIVVILRDVSEQKRMEAQLERARKMEAVLAGAVAHDLNNILGGLVTYPDFLLLKVPEDSPLREPLISIRSAGKRAAAVVQDLLTLSRSGHEVKEVVSLNQVVSDYLVSPEHEGFRQRHPEIHIDTTLDPQLLNILGSSVHLSKVLMNLVFNAGEAMRESGTVFVTTSNEYLDQTFSGFDEIPEGEYVVLSVADSGIGISEDEIERIFEPFYTKKVMGRTGTGLGMAVVLGAVKDHRGFIDITSRKGHGSKFRLFFPATRKALPRPTAASGPGDYAGRGEMILLVDDVQSQIEVGSQMLTELGYKVATASNGEEAIEHMEYGSADLVVLDMIMPPGIDGLETYQRILAIHPGQKAIIVSGFSETDRVREALRLGAGAYVKKPYLIEELGVAVRQELDKPGSP